MATYSDFVQEACWDTHEQRGMKKKGGKVVPNCVPKGSMSENQEWWIDMFRLDEGRDAAERARRRANPPQTKLDKQRDQERRARERRAQAANQRVADATAKAREGAPERREQEQARKDRAARNAAASQRVKDAEAMARPAPKSDRVASA